MNRLITLIILTALWFQPSAAFAWWQSIEQVGSSPTTLPLDGISTGIKAAFSTRQLLSAYAGKALRVQRVDNSTQQDIGFASNVLDTSSLSTFCGGTSCVVITWYDQSGNGFNLTAATSANGATIYASGAVKTLNSQPALNFVAASSNYLQNTSMTSNPVNVLYQNAVLIATGFPSPRFVYGSTANPGGYGYQLTATAGNVEIDKLGVALIGASTSSVTANTGVIVETSYNLSNGAWAIFLNRSASGSGTSVQTFTAGTTQIGAITAAGFLDGFIGELIEYDLVGGIPGAAQTALRNNQHTYWGTP